MSAYSDGEREKGIGALYPRMKTDTRGAGRGKWCRECRRLKGLAEGSGEFKPFTCSKCGSAWKIGLALRA